VLFGCGGLAVNADWQNADWTKPKANTKP